MKKTLLTLSILLFSFSCTYAGQLADTIIQSIKTSNNTLSTSKQLENLRNYKSKITSIKGVNQTDIKIIQTYIDGQITTLQKSIGTGLSIANVDLDKVRQTRLQLHNTERTKLKLPAYTYNPTLEKSATVRAEYVKNRGNSTHKRKSTDGYYNYESIKSRFKDIGVNFEGKNTLFSENIGRGYYRCSNKECTETLIKSIKTTRTFFMSEKGKSYKPHYNAIAHKSFTEIGLGISLDPKTKKYFLVTHYAIKAK